MAEQSQPSPNALERLTTHIAALRFEQLSAQAVVRTRQVVLDFIGTVLGGYRTASGQRIAEYAVHTRGGHAATLFGDGRQCSADGAAWANAAASCILGMTETHRRCGHIASEVVPAALAVGEAGKLSGRSLITAIVAGYEVFGAIQPMVRAYQRTRGFDHKGQVGTLASAVAAGVAMQLDRPTLQQALALATDMACGTEQYAFDAGTCDTEWLLAGYAAANGIAAARMAAFGFRGPPGALDGPYGYVHAFGEGLDQAWFEQLGRQLTIESTALKPHAGCRDVHACVDATQQLLAAADFDLASISSIEIGSYRGAVTPAFRVNYAPDSADSAGFSLPIAAAVVLVRGSWFPEDIAAYNDPDVRRLASLTRVYMDNEIEAAYPGANGCVVRVNAGGRQFTGRAEYARGEPERALSDGELAGKARRLAGDALPDAQLELLIERCLTLEHAADVSELARLTVAPARATPTRAHMASPSGTA